MIVSVTAILFFLAYLYGENDRDKKTGIRLNTLLVDPLILLASGLTFVYFGLGGKVKIGKWQLQLFKIPEGAAAFRTRRRAIRVVSLIFLLFFWTGVAGYYFNLIDGFSFSWNDGFYKTPGNDFAWNGYLDWFGLKIMDASTPTYNYWWKNLLASGLVLIQPMAFWLGYRLGFVTAGFQVFPHLWTRKKN